MVNPCSELGWLDEAKVRSWGRESLATRCAMTGTTRKYKKVKAWTTRDGTRARSSIEKDDEGLAGLHANRGRKAMYKIYSQEYLQAVVLYIYER